MPDYYFILYTNWWCILTADTVTHAIPKTAEVAYSVGQLWEEIALASLANNMGQG